jgi:hypothetical protein
MRRLLPGFLFFLGLAVTGSAVAQTSARIPSGSATGGVPAFSVPGSDLVRGGLLPGDLLNDDQSAPGSFVVPPVDRTTPALVAPATLPRMAPELALRAYEKRAAVQAAELVSYSSTTLIRADLPDTSQYGEYELQRHYAAPRTLEFKPVRFIGDGFVKSNVITRLLQSEVDHVQKDDTSLTAITPANYKFSYKGTVQTPSRLMHVYQVKPRKNRMGLFKGHVYLDGYTGSLVRVEGRAVKSPSLFIKKIEFAQDYVDVGAFTFPAHIHSEARTRLVGRAVVDIYQNDYQPVANTTQTALVPAI